MYRRTVAGAIVVFDAISPVHESDAREQSKAYSLNAGEQSKGYSLNK